MGASGGDDWIDIDDLTAWGADASTIEAQKAKQTIEVWKQHETVVALFSRCLSQVKTSGMGGVIGLDYMGVGRVADWCGINMDVHLLSQFQIMEAEFISVLRAS